jgi:hypothetical protein
MVFCQPAVLQSYDQTRALDKAQRHAGRRRADCHPICRIVSEHEEKTLRTRRPTETTVNQDLWENSEVWTTDVTDTDSTSHF